jgi:mannitol-1-phosphate 5-dehydrogenase
VGDWLAPSRSKWHPTPRHEPQVADQKDFTVALTGKHTFVGFGFGAIQAGLFLYEAFHSEGFARLVVGEVAPDAVDALRRNDGHYAVNIAHHDRVEAANVGPVQIENPAEADDLARLIDAVAMAEEISTAVPSVKFYTGPGPGSIHRVLAAGLRKKAQSAGPRCVVYAAENHNHAAEILEEAVFREIPEGEKAQVRDRVRFLNTVIGKMSGVVAGAGEAQARHLAPVTPGSSRAFLVESFSRILISQVTFPEAAGEPPFQRGIAVFIEKEDLLPFEEAKLYGHNATHAMAAYLCALRGFEYIADLRRDPALFAFVRDAFLKESGEALVRKHAGKDRLFTPEGYREYALDLMDRMTNPFLQDSVERVGRDPQRKLGWDDRLIGTMRACLQSSVIPHRYALAAAAALSSLVPQFLDEIKSARDILGSLWTPEIMQCRDASQILDHIDAVRAGLISWRNSGYQASLE